ncbi:MULTISPECIES: flagellar assembly peptidoglycan hydrolase FlgJ [unclassified Undibacterium]|uniref:flagellar assembly peptidoglycan hydrolase FlgJ n=1 Tax=unclassified Undibacterium TaxID=2630295 RepID=UPI002AC922A0|nr:MULTISPECIES: flagellar assembly peptidoglycan hydrolase FlgJ [unclassified Undibacterium]MEB0138780.1 flagellar assembly peptidoglycan hydrolase FlgJ [Undibacterium sp. CCC2.1]MEB0170744.1 flagellar assembly peptidoglycan hydrolase FlgJ [Undibacterium sp. CCC1.1]MEB0174633.1 flagellar assembly peptidoglycan hydrolase FlgJ [Undibacterium sp. CCC3.4]MEB0213830.1 flagellar assembly peptidoglycan hydrolase FlgJ [Undibacterium sp. 5I2]WPX42556.1 flagellar assembly peptidoglycan hydrolase FlgJ [
MIAGPALSDQSLAIDSRSLDGLKNTVKDNSPESIRAAAKQFEALFMNMMLKSMRQAGGQDSPFDNEQTRTFTSMLDQQLTQKMADRGVGLADALVKQMTLNAGNKVLQATQDGSVPASNARAIDSYLKNVKLDQPASTASKTEASIESPAREFQKKLAAHAEEASKTTGIPAKFMLGQAALETGWGKKQIKTVDGSESHNVFGMKATSAWKGKTVDAVTTEYVNGVAQRRVEKFKAYDSYSDAFKDYAHMLSNNPRYSNVIANSKDASSFAVGMQKAGYATDPQYANKLSRLIKQNLSA